MQWLRHASSLGRRAAGLQRSGGSGAAAATLLDAVLGPAAEQQPCHPSYDVSKGWALLAALQQQQLQQRAGFTSSGRAAQMEQGGGGGAAGAAPSFDPAVDPSRGFVRGGYSVHHFPPERIRNFSEWRQPLPRGAGWGGAGWGGGEQGGTGGAATVLSTPPAWVT